MAFKNIGRYEVIEELGRGGMATVYRAYDPRFEREVAIKVLPPAFLHDPQFRARFEREAKTIALLEHHAIAPVYDFGDQDGQPFIVMRLMAGGDLSGKLKSSAIPLPEIAEITKRLASALDVAHSKGIIHRDLKPGNVLFDAYNNAFLSDFGIARLTSSSTLTGSAIIGTPSYMSPEQVQGDKKISGYSDQYSLGILLYQMLTGNIPYKAETPAKVMMMHILNPVPNILDDKPDLPPAIHQVISKTLSKDPDERYPTCRSMATAFEAATQGKEITLPPAASVATTSRETLASEATPPPATAVSERAPQTVAATAVSTPPTAVSPHPQKKKINWVLLAVLGVLAVIVVIAGGVGLSALTGGTTATATLSQTATTLPPTDTPSPTAPPPTETSTPSDTAIVIADPPTGTPTPEPTATIPPSPTATSPPTETPTPSIPIEGGADKLAFLKDSDIWIVNLDGTDLTQLTFDHGKKINLMWTPDGSNLLYITGTCIKSVTPDGYEDIIVCFQAIQLLEAFAFSPDGLQIAINVDRELYIVPYNVEQLQELRYRVDLKDLATCEYHAPFSRNIVPLAPYWSDDSTMLAVKLLGVGGGLQVDMVEIYDITECIELPPRLDQFPGSRFTIGGYDTTPRLIGLDWDGMFLFAMTNHRRNDIFGDLYIYNTDRKSGRQMNPIDERCCYTDPRWSPDGRYLLFAYQDWALGAESVTVFYYVPFSTIDTGIELVPLLIDPLTDPKEAPQFALRPAQVP